MARILEALKLFEEGKELLDENEFEEALEKLDLSIKLDDKVGERFVARANCYLKLDQLEKALEDCERALKLESNNFEALKKKGIVLFTMEKFGDAKIAFEEAQKINNSAVDVKSWLKRCDAELKDIQPTTTTTTTTTTATAATTVTSNNNAKPATTTTAATTTTTTAAALTFRHEWYQNATNVFLSIFAKGVKKPDVVVEFLEQQLNVSIKIANGDSDFKLNMNLCDKIIVEQSSFDVLSTKIEIKLRKKESVQWTDIERKKIGTESAGGASSKAPQTLPQWSDTTKTKKDEYPSSSKKKKNWSAIDKEMEEELSQDKPQGEAALNHLLQNIYKDASDETRRAMLKSYQESNGTVLSTNWTEVGAKHVDCQPPNGMELKKWD